ncbi:hypothetical protein [Vulcanisaeta souniana]|uniref:Uncharacterized protein n=1 Tax=Vulcanisaeta souniana JCM 11219 TaxID=1293586 RepID=A0A830E4G3_9CREN|nr:hypothetical protein [Vulcanisaeta souniana]BDR91884.1 hypothetical protein Vsou_09770 [Vulcanisaeta souniana JCM 11219]GGI69622.1 hypothetical protein GCM10007112_03250 [Vulcanisaeta souniana JCM 11219]
MNIEKKLTKILLDLGDRPLTVIGPPGSGKTTIITVLGLMKYVLEGSSITYVTQKSSDVMGALTTPLIPWKCIRENLFLVLDSYEELSARPGITILASIANRFRTYNNYVKYLRYLAKNPRNVHALWLLERVSLLRDFVTDVDAGNNMDRKVVTNLQGRDIRGVYLTTALILNSMCHQSINNVLILDDITILPIRDEALLRIIRMTRGITNTWMVLHGIGRLNIEDLNTPTIVTNHSGIAKTHSRYREILNQIQPGEALYIGINEQLKIRIHEIKELRNKLLNKY